MSDCPLCEAGIPLSQTLSRVGRIKKQIRILGLGFPKDDWDRFWDEVEEEEEEEDG